MPVETLQVSKHNLMHATALTDSGRGLWWRSHRLEE